MKQESDGAGVGKEIYSHVTVYPRPRTDLQPDSKRQFNVIIVSGYII